MTWHLTALIAALLVDRFVGDPDWLWSHVPHPVVVMGKAIGALDGWLNRDGDDARERRRNGVIAICGLIAVSVLVGLVLTRAFHALGLLGWLLEVAVVSVFLAQKSLADHVAAVAVGLRSGGLEGGRAAVAMIVGRDPKTLDAAGVTRATIESLAENAADGVVAPALWYAVFGLPGLLACKMINTADSMIGNFSERHADFGRAAAKIDDAMNWVPARVTAYLTALAAWLLHGKTAAKRSLDVAARDARLHRSPNSGWGEASFAGALNIALAGPRDYGTHKANEAMINAAGRRDLKPADIDAALALFWRLCGVMTGLFVVLLLL